MMQTQNIGFPSRSEWEQLKNFRIPNVLINQQEEGTRIQIMNELKGVIEKIAGRDFNNLNYDSSVSRRQHVLDRIEKKVWKEKRSSDNERIIVDADSYNNNINFLQASLAPRTNPEEPDHSSYLHILADMLHHVPESRLSAKQALEKFRNVFKQVHENSGLLGEEAERIDFATNYPELNFLESLNLTKFSRDVNYIDFEHTIRRFSGVSSTIEVMSAPDRIYVPDEFTKPPNSHVMHVGMKAVKLFVEKQLGNNPDFLEMLLKNIDGENQEIVKTGLLEQLQMLLPFTWSEKTVQAWLYDRASKSQNPAMFQCQSCGTVLQTVGMGLTGSVMFGPKIHELETFAEPVECGTTTRSGRNCSLKITETHKNFILLQVRAKLQEFCNLHGFQMSLLNDWQNMIGNWFPIDQARFVVTGLSDEEANSQGSYQQLLTHSLKMDEHVAFCFKLRVSREVDAEFIYFVFSYPQKN